MQNAIGKEHIFLLSNGYKPAHLFVFTRSDCRIFLQKIMLIYAKLSQDKDFSYTIQKETTTFLRLA